AIGTNRIDPLVLLAPTLLLFAASFGAIRLLLWLFRRADAAIGRAKGLSGYLAGRRLGRSQAGGLAAAMLLLLATGLLMVSSSYRGTVLRNHADVAHSRVGANWRVAVDPSAQSLALAARLPVDAMGVYRSQADLVAGVASQATALAIDPARFTAAAWWRRDYAGRPLSDLLGDLRVPSSSPSLPAGTNRIDVTVDAPAPAGGLAARFGSGFGDGAAGVAAPLPTLPALAARDVVQAAGRQFDAVIGGAVFTVRVVDVPAGFPGTSAGESFFVVPGQVVFQGLE